MKRKSHLIIAIAGLAMLFPPTRCAAAGYTWGTTTDTITLPGGRGNVTDVTAYLVDADVMQQQAVLTAVLAHGSSLPDCLGESLLSSVTVQNGIVPNDAEFRKPSQGTDGHAYFVLLTEQDGKDLLYISGYSTVRPALSESEGSLVLNAVSSHNDTLWTTEFQGNPKAGDGGGWYGAIPEPTSGLLVLLGIAALALRRRQGR